MGNVPEPHRVTIKVSGGFVQNIYTALPFNIEVDIIDLDCAGRESPQLNNAKPGLWDVYASIDEIDKEKQPMTG